MSARKQMFAQNPCHCWWQLNPTSSSVFLQGLFTHSPQVWDSSLDEASSRFQPPKLGDGGIRAAPSPSSWCIPCSCGTTGTDCPMHSKIPIRAAGLMILTLQLIAKAQWSHLQFWVSLLERHLGKASLRAPVLCCHCCAERGASPCPQGRRHCQLPLFIWNQE